MCGIITRHVGAARARHVGAARARHVWDYNKACGCG